MDVLVRVYFNLSSLTIICSWSGLCLYLMKPPKQNQAIQAHSLNPKYLENKVLPIQSLHLPSYQHLGTFAGLTNSLTVYLGLARRWHVDIQRGPIPESLGSWHYTRILSELLAYRFSVRRLWEDSPDKFTTEQLTSLQINSYSIIDKVVYTPFGCGISFYRVIDHYDRNFGLRFYSRIFRKCSNFCSIVN